jgi:hypothetical protein
VLRLAQHGGARVPEFAWSSAKASQGTKAFATPHPRRAQLRKPLNL